MEERWPCLGGERVKDEVAESVTWVGGCDVEELRLEKIWNGEVEI